MKYEPLFGLQKLFDNAPLGTELVGHSGEFYKNSPDGPIYCGGYTFPTDEYRNIGFIAARRIVKEPKRWTWEDKKAGRFPEVGCKVATIPNFDCTVVGVDEERKNIAIQYENGKLDVVRVHCVSPIETPDEKAQRLRDEWRIKALSSASILSGMQEYELKRLGGYIEDIYDALLSGELTMPSKDGE